MSFKVVKKGRKGLPKNSIVATPKHISIGEDLMGEANPEGHERAQILYNTETEEVGVRFVDDGANAYKVSGRRVTSKACKRMFEEKRVIEDYRIEEGTLIFKA